MLDLKSYPKSLQLLMQTDGTVTELINLLANENIVVVKLLEKADKSNSNILYRHIYLQGQTTKINWLYAESKIYLNNLPKEFVINLKEKSIPIGALWIKYRIETFKKIINQCEEISMKNDSHDYPICTKILSRTYDVYNQKNIIMEITEKFPILEYTKVSVN